MAVASVFVQPALDLANTAVVLLCRSKSFVRLSDDPHPSTRPSPRQWKLIAQPRGVQQ